MALAYFVVAIFAVTAAIFGPPVRRLVTVIGVFRTPASTFISPADTVWIDDTVHCEDLHHHLESNLLFTACEDVKETRMGWFPGLGRLGNPEVVLKARGSIHVIDPKVRTRPPADADSMKQSSANIRSQTFASQRLEFENFESPFVTHGIDVNTDPENAQAVYIHAINHLPDPEYLDYMVNSKKKGVKDAEDAWPKDKHKARSQVEIFHHVLGTSTIRHVRSVWDALLTTPNDILATSPTSFFVTNDHEMREGILRDIEELWYDAKWSEIIHIKVGDLNAVPGPAKAVTASVALTGLHNNNGLSHGRTPGEIAIGSAASGRLHLGKIVNDSKIEVLDSVPLDSCIDNPSFYNDPYVTDKDGADGRSAFVLAGLARAVDLSKTSSDLDALDPVMVWLARPSDIVAAAGASKPAFWTKELLFEDDGKRVRSAAAAVLVGIDPKEEHGEKKAWLFTTGFLSKSILAVKIKI
jgi:hypothetical protein